MSNYSETVVDGKPSFTFSNHDDPKTTISAPTVPATLQQAEGSSSHSNSLVNTTTKKALALPSVDAFQNDFCVLIGKDGVKGALRELDGRLARAGRPRIISKRKPGTYFGREVRPGHVGLLLRGTLPEVILEPGMYFNLNPACSWATNFVEMSAKHWTHQGLTVVQVGQNEAAVLSDPNNRTFVLKNGGLVSYAEAGDYRLLEIVDQAHLNVEPHKDRHTGTTLGYQLTVRDGTAVVATFLNVPANNVAILQIADHLEELGAGQHCITEPGVLLRSFFTRGECQAETHGIRVFTNDQVEVEVKLYLKWVLKTPLSLANTNYATPFDALNDQVQSILVNVMSHLAYAQMVRQRTLSTEPQSASDGGKDEAFLDALRTRCMDDLSVAAKGYGIELRDLAVVDRRFLGSVAANIEKLTLRAMEIQVDSTNVERENQNTVRRKMGLLDAAKVNAERQRIEAAAAAQQVIEQARGEAEARRMAAEAEADAIRLVAKAEAEAAEARAQTDAGIRDQHARTAQLARIQIDSVKAYGTNTVFVPPGGELANGLLRNVYASSMEK
ncbi:unnamed protein product [Tilletia controversa]|uniref:Band 7 domain-containing protein n=5 Tax=Tilletia TaxID=13289 RepID=A0A8X7SV92_9BASI|nr:hypothetical protein CF336_g6291 [Tilletia laevis]KAE8191435.1 hypothetical protein CF328_g5681 [Tilletia controversa]CAD6889538.1 unnamed protein product [Tilletia caries]KAE8195566.1 hypothetical protein CF335_g5071 [Tilletia laevis]KAE8243242.1 hypothetical protein A4X06_0g6454 [Tilletia controversa]